MQSERKIRVRRVRTLVHNHRAANRHAVHDTVEQRLPWMPRRRSDHFRRALDERRRGRRKRRGTSGGLEPRAAREAERCPLPSLRSRLLLIAVQRSGILDQAMPQVVQAHVKARIRVGAIERIKFRV